MLYFDFRLGLPLVFKPCLNAMDLNRDSSISLLFEILSIEDVLVSKSAPVDNEISCESSNDELPTGISDDKLPSLYRLH